jgi:hypothetical protein
VCSNLGKFLKIDSQSETIPCLKTLRHGERLPNSPLHLNLPSQVIGVDAFLVFSGLSPGRFALPKTEPIQPCALIHVH